MRYALALLLLMLPLSACGGSKKISLAEAATKSTKATSFKTDVTMTTTSSQLPQPLTITATGVDDNSKGRAQLNIDMSSFASSLGGALGNPASWKGTEIADFSDGKALIYMKLPFFTRLVPAHKPWVKLDLNAFGQKLGFDFSQLTQLSSNPAQVLDWLRATSGTITTIGSETIDGVQTTHYRATVDLSKYPDLVPPERRAAVRRAVTILTKFAHVQAFPVDAWVGNDGLIRREYVVLGETLKGQTLNLDMKADFHDFGAPVSIAIPPANETFDLTKLALQGVKP